MLAANVELTKESWATPGACRITWLSRAVVAAGLRLNGDFADFVGRGADIGFDAIARIIQALGGDGDRLRTGPIPCSPPTGAPPAICPTAGESIAIAAPAQLRSI